MLQRRSLSYQDPEFPHDLSGVIVRNFIVHGHQIHGVGFTPIQLFRKHYLVSASDDGAVKLWYVQGAVVRLVGCLLTSIAHHSRIIDLAVSQERYVIAMWMDLIVIWDIHGEIGDGPEIYCSTKYISSTYLRTSQSTGKKNINSYVNQLEKLLTIKDSPFVVVQSSAIIFLVCIATGDTAILMELVATPSDIENTRIIWACINELSTEVAICWTANGLPFITILRTSEIKQMYTSNGSFSLCPWKYISVDGQVLIRGELCSIHLNHICIEAPQTEWSLSTVSIFPKYVQYSPNDLLLVISFHNMSCMLAYSTAEYRSAIAKLQPISSEDTTSIFPGLGNDNHQLLPFSMIRDLKPWFLTFISISVISYCEANTSYWSCTSFFFSPDSRYLAAQTKCANTKFSKNYLIFFDLQIIYLYLSPTLSLTLLEHQMVTDEARDKADDFPLGADESFIERKILPVSRTILCGCGFGISICCFDLSNHPCLNCASSSTKSPPLPYVWIVSDTMNLENTGLRFIERTGEELPLSISPLDLFLFFLSPDGTQNVWNIRMPCSSQENEGLVFSDICLSPETGELFVSNVTGQIMSIGIGATPPPTYLSPQEQFMFFELPGLFRARYRTDPEDNATSMLSVPSLPTMEENISSIAQPLMMKGTKATLNATGLKMFHKDLLTNVSNCVAKDLSIECHFSDDSCIVFDSINELEQSISRFEAKKVEGYFITSIYCTGKIETLFRYILHNAMINYRPSIDSQILTSDHMLRLNIKAPKSIFTGMIAYDTIKYLANYENPLAICSFYGTVYLIPTSIEERRKTQPLPSYLPELALYYKKVQKYGYHGFYERVTSSRPINEISYMDLGAVTPKCAHLNAMILCQPATDFLLDRASSKFLLLENVTTLKDVKQREKIELVSELLNTSEPLFATDVSGFITSSDIELHTKQVKQVKEDGTSLPDNIDSYIAQIEAAISGSTAPPTSHRNRGSRKHYNNPTGSEELGESLFSLSNLESDGFALDSGSEIEDQEEEAYTYNSSLMPSPSSSSSSSSNLPTTFKQVNKKKKNGKISKNSAKKQKKQIKNMQDTDSFIYSGSEFGDTEYSEEIDSTEESILKENTKRTAKKIIVEPPIKKGIKKVANAIDPVTYSKIFLNSYYKTLIKRNLDFMKDFVSPTPLAAGKATSYALPQVGDAIIVLPVHYRYSIQFIESFFDKKITGSTIAVLDKIIGPPPKTGFYRDIPEDPNNKPYLAVIKDIYPQYWKADNARAPFTGMTLTFLTILVQPVTNTSQITPLVTPDYELLEKLLANERTKRTYNLNITKSHDLVILPLTHSIKLEPRNPIPEFPVLPYWSGAYHLRTVSKVMGQWIKYIREGPCAAEQGTKYFKASHPSLIFNGDFYNDHGIEYCDLLENTFLEECVNYPLNLSILPQTIIQDVRKIKTIPKSFPLESYCGDAPFAPAPEHIRHPEMFTLTSRGNIVPRVDMTSEQAPEAKKTDTRRSATNNNSTTSTDSSYTSDTESDNYHFQRKRGCLRKLVLAAVQHTAIFHSNSIKKEPYFYSPKAVHRLLMVQTISRDNSVKLWGENYVPHAFGLLYHLLLNCLLRTDIFKTYSAEALFREHILDVFFPNAPTDNLTKQQLSKIEAEELKSYMINMCYQLYKDNTFASGLYYFTENMSIPWNQTQEEISRQVATWDNRDTQFTTFSLETCADTINTIEDLYIRDTNILTYIPASLFSLSIADCAHAQSSSQSSVSSLYSCLVTELVPCTAEINEVVHQNLDFSFVSLQNCNTLLGSNDSSRDNANKERDIFTKIIDSLIVRPFGIKINTKRNTRANRPRKSAKIKQENIITFDGIFSSMSIISRMRLFLLLIEAISNTLTTSAYRDIFYETFANPCNRIKNYANVVAHPLWFNMILHRVSTGYYTCFRALINDIRIIAGNWDLFNGDQTTTICAEFCEKLIDNLLALVHKITQLTGHEYEVICESVRFESSQNDEQDEKGINSEPEEPENTPDSSENSSNSDTYNSSDSSSEPYVSDGSSSSKSARNRYSTRHTRKR